MVMDMKKRLGRVVVMTNGDTIINVCILEDNFG